MLTKFIHGWNRFDGLTGKTLVVYADCRHSVNSLLLNQVLVELSEHHNKIYVIIDGKYMTSANPNSYIEIKSPSNLSGIPHVDGVITLGKPKPAVFDILSRNPSALFAAIADVI